MRGEGVRRRAGMLVRGGFCLAVRALLSARRSRVAVRGSSGGAWAELLR